MPDEPQRPGTDAGQDQSPWALAGLGAQFFGAILFFVYAGSWADRRWGTSPLFLLAGLFLGGGGSFVLSYRALTRRQRDAETRRRAARLDEERAAGTRGTPRDEDRTG